MSLAIAGRAMTPAALREQLVELGPPFVKLGQYLALRPDLIDIRYCDELMHLTDEAPAFDWALAKIIIEQDLGARIAERFAMIEPLPIGTGSLAQVHRARTLDGTLVAVKVQRPDAAATVDAAFGRERLLRRILAAGDVTRAVPADEVVSELRRWIAIELDGAIELANLVRMHDLLAREPGYQRVPRPHPALSGKRVITTELCEGVPFSELLRLAREPQAAARFDALGFDRDLLAERLIESILTQVFRLKFFHADPHPGNLIALRGDVICFIDLALADSLGPSYRRLTADYLAAIYNDDVDGMSRSLLEVLVPDRHADVDRFRREHAEEASAWMKERDAQQASGGQGSPLRRYMIGVVGVARRSGLRVPTSLLSMYRALLTAETVAEQLGSRNDLSSVGERFFRRQRCDEVIAAFDGEKLGAVGLDVLALARETPGHVQRILGDLADDKLVLSVRTSSTPADRRDADNRVKMLTLAGSAVALAVLLAGIGRWSVAGVPLAAALWPVLIGVYLWIVVLWRRMG